MSSEIIIKWVLSNNKRTYLKNKPLFLPIELQKINKIYNPEISNTLKPVSDIIDYHFNKFFLNIIPLLYFKLKKMIKNIQYFYITCILLV